MPDKTHLSDWSFSPRGIEAMRHCLGWRALRAAVGDVIAKQSAISRQPQTVKLILQEQNAEARVGQKPHLDAKSSKHTGEFVWAPAARAAFTTIVNDTQW
jgi:hypothetical protein